MPLKLDDYLIRNSDIKYERLNEVVSQWQIFPEEVLKKMGVTVEKLVFHEPTPYHFHKKTKELFKFEGEGKVLFEDVEFEVGKNDVLYVPENKKHKLTPPRHEMEGRYSTLEVFIITLPFFDSSDEFIVEEK